MPTVNDVDADAPTTASNSIRQPYKTQDNGDAAQPQQPLVLRSPDGGFGTNEQGAGEGGRGRGRITALLLVLFLLLCAIGAIAVFLFLQRAAPKTPTPSQQAQTLLQQFYSDINNRDYQGAYALLGHNFQSGQAYSNFTNGYMHTRHDDISFDSITPLSDGTVKVNMTIRATEDAATGTGTQLSTYRGSYIVGQENGSWKILSGQFNPV
ncbi:MAG TPA: hypothetical protein VKR83_14965 [Ktedonobacteraceae bacterium]|nr:hypothetical protein [Ktedonobacteraceae bacterium]